jgi:hypothetical protein
MKKVEGLIPESIYTALRARISADKETEDHILSVALAQYLDQPLHTLFSVSTSNWLSCRRHRLTASSRRTCPA